jgi:hypothetical protein
MSKYSGLCIPFDNKDIISDSHDFIIMHVNLSSISEDFSKSIDRFIDLHNDKCKNFGILVTIDEINDTNIDNLIKSIESMSNLMSYPVCFELESSISPEIMTKYSNRMASNNYFTVVTINANSGSEYPDYRYFQEYDKLLVCNKARLSYKGDHCLRSKESGYKIYECESYKNYPVIARNIGKNRYIKP